MEPDYTKLLHKAVSLLARRAYSRGELRDKLIAFGGTKYVEPALDHLEQRRLLNDAEYAYNSAARWIKQQGWGTTKVYQQLMQRQVPGSIIDAAIHRVRNELSDDQALEAYLRRRSRAHPLPKDRKGIHKLVASLQRRGFPDETIGSVLRKHIPMAACNDFESGE